jgi:hypothetical protein
MRPAHALGKPPQVEVLVTVREANGGLDGTCAPSLVVGDQLPEACADRGLRSLSLLIVSTPLQFGCETCAINDRYRRTTISTRRLSARPSGVALSARGFDGPMPTASILSLGSPREVKNDLTESARSCESFSLTAWVPVESVYPSIRIFEFLSC